MANVCKIKQYIVVEKACASLWELHDWRWWFISVAVRFFRPKPDSKPRPNSDMAWYSLIKMSPIYFIFHKDLPVKNF